MRALIAVLTLLGCTDVSAAQPDPAAPRFYGGGSLSAPIAESADKRYVINAKLQTKQLQSNGRFALQARLMPDAKVAGAICGDPNDVIFRDGFDGT